MPPAGPARGFGAKGRRDAGAKGPRRKGHAKAQGMLPAMRGRAPHGGEAAASDVVGSFLLVAITVVTAVGFGALIFAYEGPADLLHADLELRVDPGAVPAWSSGDEHVEVVHLGGEPVSRDTLRVRIQAGATPLEFSGGSLTGAFSDGELTLGEVWDGPGMSLAEDTEVAVLVATTGADQAILASGTVSGASSAEASCAVDFAPPVGAWSILTSQGTDDIDALTTGPVTFTVTLSDLCAGVKPGAPTFYWRFGTSGGYTTSAMTNVGVDQWSATIATIPVWGAYLLQTLYFRADPVIDNSDNIGYAEGSDTVQAHLTYVNSYDVTSPNVGTVDPGLFPNAQAATPAYADVQEVSVGTGTVTAERRDGSAATTGGATNPNNALQDGSGTATLDTTDHVIVGPFSLPSSATAVTGLRIGIEASSSASSNSAQGTIQFGYFASAPTQATPGWSATSAFSLSSTTETSVFSGQAYKTGTTYPTPAEYQQLYAMVTRTTGGTRNIVLDRVFAETTYQHALYDAQVEFRFVSVPAGSTQTVELAYHVDSPGDTFTVQVWQGGSLWRTCAGTLSATTASTPFSCSLNLLLMEYQGGSPRIRFLDSTGGTAARGTLHVDYARIATVG